MNSVGNLRIMATTGHRPPKLGGYSFRAHLNLRKIATEHLQKVTPDEAIVGMALGWDIAFAAACVMLGIPYIAAVPFVGQERQWPKESKDMYYHLLSKAKRVVYVSEPGYDPKKMQIRNIWMVDHCTELTAMFDSSSGGTKNCVDYATGKVPITNLWGEYLKSQS